MAVPATLERRIGALTPSINQNVRERLQEALCTLRDAGSVAGAILNVSRLIEGQRGFLGVAAAAGGHTLSRESIDKGLKRQITELCQSGILQDEVVTDLDWIRNRANKIRHNSESEDMLTINMGEMALERALHVVEWFYCKYERGPRLSSIYAEYQPVTLLERIAQLDDFSARYLKQITSTLTLDDAGNSRLRKGAFPNQLNAEPRKIREILERAQARNAEMALYTAYWVSIDHDFHGRRDKARKALHDALDLVFIQGQAAPVEWQILVLDRAAHLANKQADCAQAEMFANKMLELSQEAKQDFEVATAFQRLGRSHYFRCDSDLASDLLKQSLSQFQNLEPKDFKGIAWVQFDLGMLEADTGDLTSARDWLEKSLALHERYGDRNEEGTVRVNLAFVLHKQGAWEAARAHMNKAADLLRKENYFRWYCHFLGRIKVNEGDLDSARNHFSESLEIFRDREDTLGIIRSLLGFSWLVAKKGDWEKAAMLLGVEDAVRSGKMNLPFPLDWEDEKNFIVTGARETIGETAFDNACVKGRAVTLERAIEICLD